MASSQLSLWETEFRELFNSLPDQWSISEAGVGGLPDISQARRGDWKKYQDKGKVTFECSAGCGKTWSSLNGAVIFHYRLRTGVGIGEVKFWCLGQKCNACHAEYEEPDWPGEEIERSLKNVLRKVKEKFYGEPKEDIDTDQLEGDMKSGHRSDLCLACERGVCGRRDESTFMMY